METAPIEEAIGYLVKRVQQAFRRRSDAELRRRGLSMSQYAVLRALAEHPDASAADLARLCFVTRQSLQDVLGGLRTEGLVDDGDGPTRGRARALRLSPSGHIRLDSAHRAVLGVEAALTQGLSVDQRSQLAALLSRCAENLEAAERA